jgi:hypothetical protein
VSLAAASLVRELAGEDPDTFWEETENSEPELAGNSDNGADTNV